MDISLLKYFEVSILHNTPEYGKLKLCLAAMHIILYIKYAAYSAVVFYTELRTFFCPASFKWNNSATRA